LGVFTGLFTIKTPNPIETNKYSNFAFNTDLALPIHEILFTGYGISANPKT